MIKLTNVQGTHECGLCQKTFTVKQCLIRHIKKVHEGFSRSNGRKRKLNDRNPENHPTNQEAIEEHNDTKDQVSMDINIKIEATDESEQEFHCLECPTSFSSGYNLRKHIRAAKKETKIKCSECPLVFCTLGSLNNHMNSHHPEFDSTCKKCGKFFTKIWVLLRHIREVHNGIKRKSL